MTDYLKYINALRKCANEHEFDWTPTGHIIVSDLCSDTANLLEELEQEPITKNGISNRTIIYKAKESKEIQEDLNKLSELNKSTTKNDCEHCAKTYGTLGCCDYVNNEPVYSCKEGHEEYARGLRKFGSTPKNDLPHCQHTDSEIAKSFVEDVEAAKDQLPCGEQMDFPNTFDEFAKHYQIVDKDEHYSNGIEYIPVFRVKQWLEHISTPKNDLEVDCIDRKELIDWINTWGITPIIKNPLIRHIQGMSSVTPIRPKGHWIETAEEYYKAINEKCGGVNENTDFFTDDIACSECLAKFSVIENEAERFDFCPCCGSNNK